MKQFYTDSTGTVVNPTKQFALNSSSIYKQKLSVLVLIHKRNVNTWLKLNWNGIKANILSRSTYLLQLNYSVQLTTATTSRRLQRLVIAWQSFLHLTLFSIYVMHSNTFRHNTTHTQAGINIPHRKAYTFCLVFF